MPFFSILPVMLVKYLKLKMKFGLQLFLRIKSYLLSVKTFSDWKYLYYFPLVEQLSKN